MRVYIAGPMTGYEDFNYPAFTEAAAALRENDYEVVSPHEINPPEVGSDHPWDWYMRRDIPGLLTCDAIAMLPGWQASRGARLERHIAVTLGLFVYPVSQLATAYSTDPKRCGRWMRNSQERCARGPGHRGSCRTRWAMDNARMAATGRGLRKRVAA